MFLSLPHQKLDVYLVGKLFVIQCYKITMDLPYDEKYGLGRQIRRAAVSVQLNIAEGSSRKSAVERKRFYEIARSSVVEVDAAFELAVALNIINKETLIETGSLLARCYQMLTKMVYQ